MGQLGSELAAAGYDVTVMTLAFPGRSADRHQGVAIASVDMADFQQSIRAAVASGDYGTCLLIQDPLGNIVWSVEQLQPPAHTRVLVQPIINEDGYARWKDKQDFRRRLAAILRASTAALTMTKSGPDHRFMCEEGITPVYLPNASSRTAPAGDFRQQFGIPADRFVILHVANLYWVKNHVGLIDALPDMPANWQLVMIGTPTGAADCVAAVQAKLASRPEVMYIPGLPPEWIAAAMQAANVVVLASHGEGSPITLLEAMSHGKPWLATPTCGAANDHLGGLICALSGFMPRLRQLAAQPALQQALGEISHAHWTQCYAWPVALQGWMDLIDTGSLRRSFEPDAELVERMRLARQAIEDQAAAAVPRVALLVDGRAAAAANRLKQALVGRCELRVVSADEDAQGQSEGAAPAGRVDRPDHTERTDLVVDMRTCAASDAKSQPGPHLSRDMLAGCLRQVDYSVFHVDAYRQGPVRFGWVGDVSARAEEVHGLLIPAMRDRHQVSILNEQAGPAELAAFLQGIDVLLLTSEEEHALAAAVAAMACAVFPLGVRRGRLAELLEYQLSGQLAAPSGAALHEAMNWCSAHGDELRRRSYRQAQAMALQAPDLVLPAAFARVLEQALGRPL
ncbi:glycosyltransferase family 4 protein [Pseudoduganella sp. LjRoot289]|uniref:glycosyltransferase family 4 protein n=1 Tax=Pseudoduganella sp. LjRoot289 TaxID=3342314 RepID=UPI003ECE5B49